MAASINNWLDFSLSNNLTVNMQESGGHENQSASRNSMVVASNSPQLGIGYNTAAYQELPSNSTLPTVETADISALRHNGGPGFFMEALNRTDNGGLQSDEADEPHGYNALQLPHSANNVHGSSSNFMWFMANCPSASDENKMRNATTTPITTAAVTTTTAKVQPVPSSLHEGANVKWLVMSQTSDDRSEQNNNPNTTEEKAAIGLRPGTIQNSSNNKNILANYSLHLPQSSGNDVYGLPNGKWFGGSQASEETNMNNTNNFPAHIAAAATSSAANEMNSNDDSPSSTDSRKRALETAITPYESDAPSRLRVADPSLGHRTSIYRGVTRHRWTGRYEAHLWDNSSRRENQTRKGRQVYLGGYDQEEKAARAYDMAALKYWGPATTTNFHISQYKDAIEEMQRMTRQEYVASLRRKSSGFSRGASKYRGVTRHHQHGRWQARIGRVAGNKDLYLGTFGSEKEAAEAYDVAAIKFRGPNAVTNFDMSKYDLKSIENSTLPIGAAKRLRAEAESAVDGPVNNGLSPDEECTMSSQTDATSYIGNADRTDWLPRAVLQQQSNPLQQAYQLQRVSLYNQEPQMQLLSANQKKYLQATGSTPELHNIISLGSAVNNHNNASSSIPGIYSNISNALANCGLLVGNPSDRRAVIFGENSDGIAAPKPLTYGNMLLSPEQFARSNPYYLYQQQQQSSGSAKPTSDNLAYNGMEARPNLTVGHAPIFTAWNDSQG